jgi:dTDP-4-amino-4,6-dideoxygalactose transaminase
MNTTVSAIPLSLPWYDEQEQQRVAQALASRTSGDGPFGRRVERRLAEWWGAKHVLLTTSCTHALELALLALGIGPGDEVVCPSFTFVSTANAVLRVGARPVFADIEEATLGLDPLDVERCLTPRTRALLPVHYAGIAAPMDALLAIAARIGARVVEDAAQAVGSRYRDRAVGTLGDAGCFSFHETKNLSCGEGGALFLADDATAARAEIIREKGTNRSAFLRGEIDKYTWVMEGSSYILSDVLAAMLDAQIDKAPEIARRRAAIAERYRAELTSWASANDVRLPAVVPDRVGNDHIFYLLFPDGAVRDRAMTALKSQGVMATFHYVPLHSSPMGIGLHDGRALPVTERVAERLLRLPMHARLSSDDVGRVTDAVRRCLSA